LLWHPLRMRKIAIVALLLSCFFGADARARRCIQPSECCRICTKGKACGNSCINVNFTCHKGWGCSCDVEEVCGEGERSDQ
jgi:hypothetical protein